MDTLYLDAPMENLDPSYKHDGKAAPYGSGYRPAKKITKEDVIKGNKSKSIRSGHPVELLAVSYGFLKKDEMSE